MKSQTAKQFLATMLMALVLTGCDIFDDDDNPVVVIGDPGPGGLSQISAQSANSDPLAIDDAAALGAAVTTLFGDANGDPVALQAGESLEAIIQRVSGS